MTFDPKTLTQEERALWDSLAIQERRNRRVASESYSETEGAFRDLVKARRALFGEPASQKKVSADPMCSPENHHWSWGFCTTCMAYGRPQEPASEGKVEKFMPCGCVRCTCENENQCQGCGAKMCELHRLHREPASEGGKVGEGVDSWHSAAEIAAGLPSSDLRQFVPGEGGKVECPNCGELTRSTHEFEDGRYECQSYKPAQPEPAKVCPHCLEELGDGPPSHQNGAPGDVGGWMCSRPKLAQPAPAVAMTVELSHVLAVCDDKIAEARLHASSSPPSKAARYNEEADAIAASVAAVRSQAAEAGKVRMLQVRIALDTMRAHFEPDCQGGCQFPMVWDICRAALAELDAAEGRK